jgi:transposase
MGAAPNIPPKANRRWKNCFSPYLYRDRNAIERMFGRLKDFAESQLDTTATPTTSSPPSVSSLPSAIGYESEP